MKKIVIGLASTCLAVGVSASVIYANEDKESIENNMIHSIEVFEPGTMESEVTGVEMTKEIVDDITATIEILDEEEMNSNIADEKMFTKEIIKK